MDDQNESRETPEQTINRLATKNKDLEAENKIMSTLIKTADQADEHMLTCQPCQQPGQLCPDGGSLMMQVETARVAYDNLVGNETKSYKMDPEYCPHGLSVSGICVGCGTEVK